MRTQSKGKKNPQMPKSQENTSDQAMTEQITE